MGKKSLVYDGHPPRGLSEVWRDKSFLIFLSQIRRGGVPSGTAAFIITEK